LQKPAMLDAEEMRVMRGHAAIGGDMTHGVEFLERIRPIIRNHHERYDGSGYPDGIKGESIPMGARIVAVADTWDAIVSDRCYQVGRPPEEAMHIISRLAGATLDRSCVEALRRALLDLHLIEPPQLEMIAINAPLPRLDADPEDDRSGRVDIPVKN
jgi:HD-GYP domain-containing protein (c-di-GMP phosphodiesterase class II)